MSDEFNTAALTFEPSEGHLIEFLNKYDVVNAA